METFLEEVADTAEEVAAEQQDVARQARTLQHAREKGTPWYELLDRHDGAGLLGRLRESNRKLGTATARLSKGFAERLSSEGHSQRAIARCLGVTHQRISAMLGRRRDAGKRQA